MPPSYARASCGAFMSELRTRTAPTPDNPINQLYPAGPRTMVTRAASGKSTCKARATKPCHSDANMQRQQPSTRLPALDDLHRICTTMTSKTYQRRPPREQKRLPRLRLLVVRMERHGDDSMRSLYVSAVSRKFTLKTLRYVTRRRKGPHPCPGLSHTHSPASL